MGLVERFKCVDSPIKEVACAYTGVALDGKICALVW